MDSRGWIPISLIASFNRVRALTTESHLVMEVLMLSSLVEVKGSHVRMRQWQQYVLPTAPASTVPEDDPTPLGPVGDDDEDEDVVFVM